jgi:hypothetical protein
MVRRSHPGERISLDDLAKAEKHSDVVRSMKHGAEFGNALVGRVYTFLKGVKPDPQRDYIWRFPVVYEKTGSRAEWTQWQVGSLIVAPNIGDPYIGSDVKERPAATHTWYEWYESHGELVKTFEVEKFVGAVVDGNEKKPVMPVFCYDITKLKELTKKGLENEAVKLIEEPFATIRDDVASAAKRRFYINQIRRKFDLVDYVYDHYLDGEGLSLHGINAQQGQLHIIPLRDENEAV